VYVCMCVFGSLTKTHTYTLSLAGTHHRPFTQQCGYKYCSAWPCHVHYNRTTTI